MNSQDTSVFRATTGRLQGFGNTPQEALTTLMERLAGDVSAPILISPFNKGDAYFTDTQQARLQELKERSSALNAEERGELEALVAAAFDATITRSRALALLKK